jgi:hypothetical protein
MKIVTIGRSHRNDVVIDDPLVSNFHLKIILDDTGNFYLIDYGSENGTFVNEARVNGDICLNRNDTVRTGNTVLPWKDYFSEKKIRTVTPNSATVKPANTNINAGTATNTVRVFAAVCSCILVIAFFLPWIHGAPGYKIPLNALNVLKTALMFNSKENMLLITVTLASLTLYLIPVFACINFVSYLGVFNSRCRYMEFLTAFLACIGLFIAILTDNKMSFEYIFWNLSPGFYITFGVSILGLIAYAAKPANTKKEKSMGIKEITPLQTTVIVEQPQQQSNGVGIAGFVLSLISIFIFWIPVIGWIVWLLGFILSLVGLSKKPRGLAVAGVTVSSVVLIFLLMELGVIVWISSR